MKQYSSKQFIAAHCLLGYLTACATFVAQGTFNNVDRLLSQLGFLVSRPILQHPTALTPVLRVRLDIVQASQLCHICTFEQRCLLQGIGRPVVQ